MMPAIIFGHALHGKQQSIIGVTVLVGVIVDGTNTFPLVLIGNNAKERAFRNVNIQLTYLANNGAWMTLVVIVNWLEKLNWIDG